MDVLILKKAICEKAIIPSCSSPQDSVLSSFYLPTAHPLRSYNMVFLSAAPPAFNAVNRVFIRKSAPREETGRILSSLGSLQSELHSRLGGTIGWVCNPGRSTLSHHSAPHKLSEVQATAERQIYQPFRPPPAVVPGSPVENLSVEEQLLMLRDRRGRWHEYANYVPSLIRNDFTPSMIDEATGMSGVEQNKIVVGSQVLSSLKSSGMDEASLAYFDVRGEDILYELRILSAEQRKSAAEFVIERKMDPRESRDLARAIKDYVRRKREEGWDYFSFHPGDCLAYACYRQSKEYKNDLDTDNTLRKGLTFAVSEKARAKLLEAMQKLKEVESSQKEARLQVVRLSSEEVSKRSTLLPVIGPTLQEFEDAPVFKIVSDGPFSIQHSQIAWKDWVAVPDWEPLATSVAPVAISCPDASILTWTVKSGKKLDEPILLIVDKGSNDLEQEKIFLVADEAGRLSLQLGTVVSETGVKALAKAVLALQPPSPQFDEL